MMMVPKTMRKEDTNPCQIVPGHALRCYLFQAELQGRCRHGGCPKWTKQERQKLGLLKANGYGFPDPMVVPATAAKWLKTFYEPLPSHYRGSPEPVRLPKKPGVDPLQAGWCSCGVKWSNHTPKNPFFLETKNRQQFSFQGSLAISSGS